MKKKRLEIMIVVFLGITVFGFLFYSCEKQEKTQVPEPSWDDFKKALVGEDWQILDENIQALESPDSSAKAVCSVPPGSLFKILKTSGSNEQWKLVERKSFNVYGWVNASLIKKARLIVKVEPTPPESIEFYLSKIENKLKNELSYFSKARVEFKERDGTIDIYVDYNGYGDVNKAGVIVLTVKFVGKDMLMLDIFEKFEWIYFLRFGKKELRLRPADAAIIMLQETPEEREAWLRKRIKPIEEKDN